jgi:hypothetical protein
MFEETPQMFEAEAPPTETPKTDSSSWSGSDIGHLALDVGGLVPVVGEAADVANAVWYAAEGNYLDAGLSLISIIPVVGDVIGKGGKLVKRLGSKAIKKILQALKKINIPAFLKRFKAHPKLGKYIDNIAAALKKWQDDLAKKFSPSKAGKGTAACPKCKVTSSGAVIKPNPNKTTTILGNHQTDMKRIIEEELKAPKNVDFGPKKGGFNVLNVPDEVYKGSKQFFEEVNKPFLDEAIKRGDDILMASDPTLATNIFRADGTLTGFGMEIEHLAKNGYVYDAVSKMMVKIF